MFQTKSILRLLFIFNKKRPHVCVYSLSSIRSIKSCARTHPPGCNHLLLFVSIQLKANSCPLQSHIRLAVAQTLPKPVLGENSNLHLKAPNLRIQDESRSRRGPGTLQHRSKELVFGHRCLLPHLHNIWSTLRSDGYRQKIIYIHV